MTYQWRVPFFKTDANDAASELSRIGNKYGSISAKAVVEESKNPEAVLHKEFEWNDEIAAEKYREHQASVLICSISVVPEEDKGEQFAAVRAFVNTPSGYKDIKTVLKVKEDKDYMIECAIRELRSFQGKYNSIRLFEKLFSMIDELEKEYTA